MQPYFYFSYPELRFNNVNFGKSVRLSAKIKTEDVEGTVLFSAGSGIRVPHKVTDVTPVNRVPSARTFTGTNDWTSVVLEFDVDSISRTHPQVFFYLKGKGKAWMDDLQVTIDPNVNTSVESPIEEFDNTLSAYAIGNSEIRIIAEVSMHSIAKLYDVQGRTLLTKNLSQGNLNVIPIQNIRKGIYLLSIKTENQFRCFKIIIR